MNLNKILGVSEIVCGIFYFQFRFVFIKVYIYFCSTKSMDFLILKRHKCFQN